MHLLCYQADIVELSAFNDRAATLWPPQGTGREPANGPSSRFLLMYVPDRDHLARTPAAPPAPESVAAFRQCVAGIDIRRCAHCGLGTLRSGPRNSDSPVSVISARKGDGIARMDGGDVDYQFVRIKPAEGTRV